MSSHVSSRPLRPAEAKRRVTFLVPASPTPAFFSQIAAFRLALDRLPWTHWEPSMLASFGGGLAAVDGFQLERWRPYLDDVTMTFAHARPHDELYDGQVDELYRAAPRDADVLVRIDADMLPTADLEPILDFVHERSAMAGVIAHYRFPAPEGVGNREAWLRIEEQFPDAPLGFDHVYSLTTPSVPDNERVTPFYLNEGCVFIAREYFDRLAPLYLDTRPRVAELLADPYYAGQVALTLSAARISLPTVALPLRYNFPNDPVAAEYYPDEMEAATVIHYLRRNEFDRHKIFRWPEMYALFMQQRLSPENARFRDAVRELLGEDYPFADGARVSPTSRQPVTKRSASDVARIDGAIVPTYRRRAESPTLVDPWLVDRLPSQLGGALVLELAAAHKAVLSGVAIEGLVVDVVDIDAAWDHKPSRSYPCICSVGAIGRLPRVKRDQVLTRVAQWIEPGGRLLLAVDVMRATDLLANGSGITSVEEHGSIQDVLDAIEAAGLCVSERVMRRTLNGAPTDVFLVEALLTSP